MADKQPGANGNPAADPRFYAQGGHILIGGSDAGIEYIELKLANRHGLDHRRDRHRQDGDAAGPGRRLLGGRRPRVRRRHQGRPVGHRASRASRSRTSSSAPRRSASPATATPPFPVVVLGHVRRAGPSGPRHREDMGPLLLSRLLELTEPQEGVLNIAFRWAEDERAGRDPNMVIRDLADLRAVIDEMGRRAPRAAQQVRQRRAGRPSASCSAACWCWRSRAPTSSSASRRSISTTS